MNLRSVCVSMCFFFVCVCVYVCRVHYCLQFPVDAHFNPLYKYIMLDYNSAKKKTKKKLIEAFLEQ